MFINEHLTKKNGKIADSQIARRQGKISTMWTMYCKVFMKAISVPEVATIHQIRNMTDLVDLKKK